MKIISDLEQRTAPWFEYRRNHVMATDSGVLLGLNKDKTAYQLWLEKLGYDKQLEPNQAMRRGIELEPFARELFEEQVGVKVFPVVVESSEHQWAAASLDGLSEDKKTLVEIKVSGDNVHEKVKVGIINPLYVSQIQHQMMCAELDEATYFSFNGLEGIQVKIYRDDDFIKNMIAKELEFWDRVQNFEPPTACDKDYQHIESDTLNNLSKEILRIRREKDILAMQEGDVRDQIEQYTQNGNIKNNYIRVERVVRKGNIIYKNISALSGVNLELYRGDPIQYWKISHV